MGKDEKIVVSVFMAYFISALFTFFGQARAFISPHLVDDLVIFAVALFFLFKSRDSKWHVVLIAVFASHAIMAFLLSPITPQFLDYLLNWNDLAAWLISNDKEIQLIYSVVMLVLMLSLLLWMGKLFMQVNSTGRWLVVLGLGLVSSAFTCLIVWGLEWGIFVILSLLLMSWLFLRRSEFTPAMQKADRRYMLLFLLMTLLQTLEYLSMHRIIER